MPERKLLTLPVLLPAVVLAALAWQLNFLCDDAFISFRYTRNLIEGNGLCYNPTSRPPVEGYSNFLWVLLMAPFQAIGWDLGLASRGLSVVCALVLCLWVSLHARQRFELDKAGTLLTGLFFATLPATALWSTGGLATMPAALLLFGCYERLLGDPHKPRGVAAGLFAGALVLMRADGFVWVGLLLLGTGVSWLWERREHSLGKALLRAGAIAAAITLVHFAWRYSYYGDWLPNTARVKAGFSMFRLERGFDYLAQWFLTLPSIAFVLLLAMRPIPRDLRGPLCASWVIAIGAHAYALWVGGDFMPFGRFVFGAVPFITLLAASQWKRLAATGPRGALLASAMGIVLVTANALACFDINPVPESFRQRFHFRLNAPSWQSEMTMRANMILRTEEWTRLGKALGMFTGAEDSIVLAGIGAIGYYSDLQIHDIYGLVSPEVIDATEPQERATPGHDRVVTPEFFSDQKPTLGGAFFAPSNAPPSFNMPPGWAQHPLSKILRLKRHPLPDNGTFPPGMELRLMVYTSWP